MDGGTPANIVPPAAGKVDVGGGGKWYGSVHARKRHARKRSLTHWQVDMLRRALVHGLFLLYTTTTSLYQM